MRYIITGGAGFIGSHLTKRLIEDKSNTVLVLDDLSVGKLANIPSEKVIFRKIDIRDAEKLKECVLEFKPDIVIHLAAKSFIPNCEEYPLEAVQVNVQGTVNLVKALSLLEHCKLISFSSGAVYKPSNKHLTEEDALGPIEVYGLSKFLGEEYLNLYRHLFKNIDIVICRLFNTYGTDTINPYLFPEIVKQLKATKNKLMLGNLDTVRSYIHVSDVINAIVSLIDCNVSDGTFNIGNPAGYSVAEVVVMFETLFNTEIEVVQSEVIKRKVDRKYQLADISKITNLTSWHPVVDLSDGLKELIAL